MRLHQIKKDFGEKRRLAKTLQWFKDKKEWAKLNTSYLAGTLTGVAVSYGSSYLAEKKGISREHATTWIAGTLQYVSAIATILGTWMILHKEVYAKDKKKLLTDTGKLAGTTILAQIPTWICSWTATLISVSLGASNVLAVTIQQIVDRLVFIPLYNYLNRNRVKEMEAEMQRLKRN